MKELEVYTKKNSFSGFSGEYLSAFKGRGLEFTGFKDYDSTEDASKIDWKASLRAHKLLSRVLIEERNLEIMFLFDVSSSMSFASVEKLKNEYAAELVATLCFSVLNAGDSVGLIMFTAKIVKFIPPRMGNHQYYSIIQALSDPKLYDGNMDIVKALGFIGNVLRSKSIIILVSDFIGFKGDWKKKLASVGIKYELIGIMVRDPRDDLMVDVGQVVISDPFSDEETVIDTTKIKIEYETLARQQTAEVEAIFKKIGADFLHLTTDKPFIKPVLELFRRRRAGWR